MSGEGRAVAENVEAEEDREMKRIVDEEEKVLSRVVRTLDQHRPSARGTLIDYDAELLALRDQIREARLEDIPPLVEEMERLQQVAKRRAEVTLGLVDPNSPYFGRLVLEEDNKKREVLIGRSTFVDPKTGIRIVDWRDAPISRVFYRYEEGDAYEESFGDRDVEGDVLVRRSLSIAASKLRRITSPQGTFTRKRDGGWQRASVSATKLSGGQGAAMRPEGHHKQGQLGTGEGDAREDKHLSEITALIDPRQFDLITKPTSGLVVIQGGAGSGKTTIGLHRLAYLAFQDPKRFKPERMLVVVFNDALVRYIARVLPALGVEGVQVVTYEKWAEKLRASLFHDLPLGYAEDTPTVVTRFKKHPAMLKLAAAYVARLVGHIHEALVEAAKKLEGGGKVLRVWESTAGQAPGLRLRALRSWLREEKGEGRELSMGTRHAMERIVDGFRERVHDVDGCWADMLTDKDLVLAIYGEAAKGAFTERELEWAIGHSSRRAPALIHYREERNERAQMRAQMDTSDEESPAGEDDADDYRPVDGHEDVDEKPRLDREDDAILIRLHQLLEGPITKGREVIHYEHVFVDETQDLSPVELSVVLEAVTEHKSITLAGDVAQKLHLDNGFSDWRHVLEELDLAHVEIEPLKLAYRSTHEILEFATDVLGPLRNEVSGTATRHGAPVELFEFVDSGEAVGFLSESLRNLVREEPLASVAIIARHPEQADLYYKGLRQGEVPNLRRVADQDFAFRPGVEVTDVRQVKGLEFDYVVLVDVNTSSYPADHESRHLLHIGATRAAHQLWVVSTATPSQLLPESLRSNEM
ncbi:MAG: ATP-binding domain-containing protein [Polyangiales bacterium]